MNKVQRDALRGYLADTMEVPVIWAHKPAAGQAVASPPPRPYIALIAGLDQGVGAVVKKQDGDNKFSYQLREITLTLRVMADDDWQATDMLRDVWMKLHRQAAILLADEHRFGLMRDAGIVDNSKVQDASWVGRAEQDLIFSYATTDTEEIGTIEGAQFDATFHEPETEFVAKVTPEE